ncbi:spermidine synthase [Rhodopirellula sp. JC639]|uniref:spermidine synthase n=1 Tax=Stieleria mannarensis TaxID=2755585 RepID=UPI0015FF9679|nr:fused MFS/spermidine synthase [Rhodopirellula sp. JC639]
MLRYALTIFTSAFLLFQVQPIIGRFILPWFGGGPSIWTSCLLFFQSVLLAGYLYAHLLSTKLSIRIQGIVHLAVLVATVLLLPIAPDESWKPQVGQSPLGRILLVLIATVGGPYFVLASTGPLMQKWFSQTSPGRSPYRLYALSNIGSLLALLSYPFAIEPRFTLDQQVISWTSLYVVFACSAAWCAARMLKQDAIGRGADPVGGLDESPTAEPSPTKPSRLLVLLWLCLSASGSAMLLATTNQLCIDVAAVPFLWILPLSLYLISFIICFDHPKWYDRRAFGLLLMVSTPLACWAIVSGADVALAEQVAIFSAVQFACCMACHGELVHARPDPRHLTLFYLVIAAGGALGGFLVAIVATNLFTGYWEFQISLVACCSFALIAACRQRIWDVVPSAAFWLWVGGALAACGAIAALVWTHHHESLRAADRVAMFGGLGLSLVLGMIVIGTRTGNPISARTWYFWGAVPIAWMIAWGRWRVPDVMTISLGSQLVLASVLAWSIAFFAQSMLKRFGQRIECLLTRAVILVSAVLLLALAYQQQILTPTQAATVLLVGVAGLAVPWGFRRLRSTRQPSLSEGTPRDGILGIGYLAPVAALVAIMGYELWQVAETRSRGEVHRSRNFYGVLSVDYRPAWEDDGVVIPARYRLEHGQILHGVQYDDDDWRRRPTTYYGQESGIGLAIQTIRDQKMPERSIRVGVVGLGAGTIAAYGEANDTFRFYEINPAVQELSGRFFTYLRDSAANTQVQLGDARIVMERELQDDQGQRLDVLAIDAFSSDAIPVHLLTAECGETYRAHLADDGILVIHISNRFLDLGPVVRGLADTIGWQSVRISNDKDTSAGVFASTWVLLTGSSELAERLKSSPAYEPWRDEETVLIWTDNYSGVWELLSL